MQRLGRGLAIYPIPRNGVKKKPAICSNCKIFQNKYKCCVPRFLFFNTSIAVNCEITPEKLPFPCMSFELPLNMDALPHFQTFVVNSLQK